MFYFGIFLNYRTSNTSLRYLFFPLLPFLSLPAFSCHWVPILSFAVLYSFELHFSILLWPPLPSPALPCLALTLLHFTLLSPPLVCHALLYPLMVYKYSKKASCPINPNGHSYVTGQAEGTVKETNVKFKLCDSIGKVKRFKPSKLFKETNSSVKAPFLVHSRLISNL